MSASCRARILDRLLMDPVERPVRAGKARAPLATPTENAPPVNLRETVAIVPGGFAIEGRGPGISSNREAGRLSGDTRDWERAPPLNLLARAMPAPGGRGSRRSAGGRLRRRALDAYRASPPSNSINGTNGGEERLMQ